MTAERTGPGLRADQEGEHMSVIDEIAAERQRQVESEGWTPEHDDQWSDGELARAAGCYAVAGRSTIPVPTWPWSIKWFKPTSYRRNLIKAAALIVAEIERLDRRADQPS
jgi:hypothetical protein